MADITFDAKLREKAGKGAARACRREGRVPAVVYGGNKEALMISLDPVQLEKALDMVGFYDADIEINVDGKNTKLFVRMYNSIRLVISRCTSTSSENKIAKGFSCLLFSRSCI